MWFIGKVHDLNKDMKNASKERKAILDNLSEAVITTIDTELSYSNRVADELLIKVRELNNVENFLDAKVFIVEG
jgi:nitrogen-specific signal transduction histidine kinase